MSGNNKGINMKMVLNNIGPHDSLNFQKTINSINIGIYGNNGEGKTYISRMFRIVNNNDVDESYNKYISIGKTNGDFLIEFKNTNDSINTNRFLSVKLEQNKKPIIKNNTDFIFHVFNRDFIKENLENSGYKPSGDIEGYILGKVNIDVSKEKEKLEDIINEASRIDKNIEDAVSKARKDLDSLQINKNTREYKILTLEKLKNPDEYSEEESFSQLKTLHQTLKSMPDNLEDVPELQYNVNSDALNDIQKLLGTSYSKSNLHDEFIKKVKEKQIFIEEGLKLYNNSNENICPFCEQNLSEQAIDIINLYNQYLNNTEAKIIKELDVLISRIESLKSEIEKFVNNYYKVKNKYNETRKYIPSLQKEEFFVLPESQFILGICNRLCNLVEQKKKDIASVDFDYSNDINEIILFLNELKKVSKNCTNQVYVLNNKMNSIQKEKLQLNRRLCIARFLSLKKDQEENLNKLKEYYIEKTNIENEIKEKESKAKISKKKKVVETLKYFLDFFFKNKYIFDESKFCIKFMGKHLINNASDVLSDGEKSIVAFCYYLASVHTIVENESDYEKLFFVIDDPISSMDFHYVYAVAQIIRNLNRYFSENSFVRFIILTHNLEFISLLTRNKVLNQKYVLSNGKIDNVNEQLVLPYENHLSDIYKVATKKVPPSHTTPNSVRHVLETICHFEYPNKGIEDFIQENEELKNNNYLYSLMQDLSHGAIRLQRSFTDDIIINACNAVINFIKSRYAGQIEKP